MNMKLDIQKIIKNTNFDEISWNENVTDIPKWIDVYVKVNDYYGIMYINDFNQCRWSHNGLLLHTRPLAWQNISKEIENICLLY